MDPSFVSLDVALKFGGVDLLCAQSALVINSQWHERFAGQRQIVHYQPLYPKHRLLIDQGARTINVIDGNLESGAFSSVLLVGSRNKKLDKGFLSYAFDLLSGNGGQLLVGCSNEFGSKSLQKAFEELFELNGVESKAHSRTFWGVPKSAPNLELLSSWRDFLKPFLVDGTSLFSWGGGFAAQNVDEGSNLLATELPQLQGVGADLGSSYGFLSVSAINISGVQSGAIKCIHLIESDYNSLEMARRNLANAPARFHWADVARTSEIIKAVPAVDWVVMNPPFHADGHRCLEVGLSFFRTAQALLKPTGCLFWVANRHLPYMQSLGWGRSHYKILKETNKYIVGVYQREK